MMHYANSFVYYNLLVHISNTIKDTTLVQDNYFWMWNYLSNDTIFHTLQRCGGISDHTPKNNAIVKFWRLVIHLHSVRDLQVFKLYIYLGHLLLEWEICFWHLALVETVSRLCCIFKWLVYGLSWLYIWKIYILWRFWWPWWGRGLFLETRLFNLGVW